MIIDTDEAEDRIRSWSDERSISYLVLRDLAVQLYTALPDPDRPTPNTLPPIVEKRILGALAVAAGGSIKAYQENFDMLSMIMAHPPDLISLLDRTEPLMI